MDSIHNSVSSSSESIVADLSTASESIVGDLSTVSEEIVVSDDVSAKYTEEIVAYEHGDESEAIKSKLFSVNKLCLVLISFLFCCWFD